MTLINKCPLSKSEICSTAAFCGVLVQIRSALKNSAVVSYESLDTKKQTVGMYLCLFFQKLTNPAGVSVITKQSKKIDDQYVVHLCYKNPKTKSLFLFHLEIECADVLWLTFYCSA